VSSNVEKWPKSLLLVSVRGRTRLVTRTNAQNLKTMHGLGTFVGENLKGHDADSLPRIPFTEDYLRCLRLNLILIEQTVAQIEFIDDDFEERCRRNGQNCSC
jgi:hypothetical protein